MSKGTDKLKEVMDQHEVNLHAVQVALTAKGVADANFADSAKQLEDAVQAIQTEASDMAREASRQIPVPDQSNTSILDAGAPPVAS